MDDLIDQLREANPEPRPDALPIELIWNRLAALQSSHPGRARSRRAALRRTVGWLAGVFAVGTTVIVVVIFGLSIRSHPRVASSLRSSPGRCSPSMQPTPVAGGPPVFAGQRIRTAGRPSAALLSRIALLREPIGPQDQSAAGCAAQSAALSEALPADPAGYRVRADPSYVRYVGPGILGGEVFMYALPGVPHALAYRGMPSNSSLAKSETEPTVCLITIGGSPAANPRGCTNLIALHAGVAGLDAAQIPGTSTSALAAVVPDGITAVRVYDGDTLIKTVPVHHNVVQLIVDHNAPAAARLRLLPAR